ncbi:MAG: glycoside hydrolase family 18 [Porphyromonas sp.]|nr:glycoside hydrolase family 18 [Porphyromonas sp.]
MKNIKSILALSLGLVSLAACSKWTDTEIKNPTDLTSSNKSDAYYAKLREYKKSDHEVTFGWFSGWTAKGSSLQSSLAGLPDSIDIISMWGGWGNLDEAKKADLKHFQEVKGGKALICFLILDIGASITPELTDAKKAEYAAKGIAEDKMWTTWRHEFWDWSTEDTEAGQAKRIASAEKYANAICDTIYKYGYDGFDLDAEPSYRHPFHTDYEMWKKPGGGAPDYAPAEAFVKAMGKRIGRKAETEEGRKKLFVIDGEPEAFSGEFAHYFDYFISQAYGDGNVPATWRLSNLMRSYGETLGAEEVIKRWIITANFERYASTGGAPDGQLLAFAAYQPTWEGKSYRKGGVGAFRFDMGYRVSVPDHVQGFSMKDVQGTTHPWMRKAIKIMNPVIE